MIDETRFANYQRLRSYSRKSQIKNRMGAECCKEEPFVLEEENLHAHLVRDQNRDFSEVYDVVKVIGHGSISTISKIKKKVLDEKGMRTSKTKIDTYYALKEIDMSIVENHLMEELENEINLLKALDHPNIIKVYETYKLKKRKAIVMELCSGGDLYTRNPYSEKQAAKIVKECLSAVAYLHSRNVIHRDIKYENIMFESEQPDARVKLIDFGLSKSFMRKSDVFTERVGTLYTMSPQVVQGVYTAQADLWSMGVVAFMLLSGSDPPFWGNNPQEIVSKVIYGTFKFKGKIWKSRSLECKDFVKSLIKMDPKIRLTAFEALKHNWMSKEIDLSDEKPNSELLHDVENSIANYAVSPFLKKIALNVVAKNSTSYEIFELRKVFDEFDKDNAGTITFEELKVALGKTGNYDEQEIKTIFEQLDVNENGVIMYTEFLAASLEAQGRIEERRVKEAFDVLDVDNTGFISAANLRKIVGENCSDKIIDEIVQSADIDGDGQISYDEFKCIFEKQNNEKIKDIYKQNPKKSEQHLLGLNTIIPGGIAAIGAATSMLGVQVRKVGSYIS